MDNKRVVGTFSTEEEAIREIERLKASDYTKDDKDASHVYENFYEKNSVIRDRYQQYRENNKVKDINIPTSNK